MHGLPTNTFIVTKVSGRMSRWRDTYEFGVAIPADTLGDAPTWTTDESDDDWGRFDLNVITDGAWRTIPQSAGVPDPTEPDAGAIAGTIRDCGTEDRGPELIRGARVGFIQDPTALAYFNGVSSDTLPQPGQAYTNKDGVYAAIDLQAGPNRISVLVKIEGELVNAGLRDVFLTPYSVAIATFEGNFE
jgi:hypothetical protein